MKISRLVASRPRNRCRASANAISVPSTVAISVASSAISMLRPTASHMSPGPHGFAQLSSVNRWKSYDRRLDGSLNDSAATTKIGRKR